jgi:hypothetical protein
VAHPGVTAAPATAAAPSAAVAAAAALSEAAMRLTARLLRLLSMPSSSMVMSRSCMIMVKGRHLWG